MLADKDTFDKIEKSLAKQGIIKDFEKESGKIKARMMITLGEVPDELREQITLEDGDHFFIGSFDIFDTSVGIVFNPKEKKAKSGVFVNGQVDGAAAPSNEWLETFLRTLRNYVRADGSFGVPMFTFCSKNDDFTIVPS
ncbi:hypothetical protein [uncultured Ruminococcus sp.]|uniref:hypothetical protein n=1 Tax=uncultured Ruminococcus sp. TaxID=165186 RepID=UPI0026150CF3|nr:hypothetical protein [uncultured Ruminococcus sp.]